MLGFVLVLAQTIAEKYPDDDGIAKDPRVLFADDFEGWERGRCSVPEGTWEYRHSKDEEPAHEDIVAGKVASGANVLRISCWAGGRSSAGLTKFLGNYQHRNQELGPGHEEIYVRYYQKLGAGYTPVRNHGANLGGRDVTRSGSWWVGQARIRDVSSKGYFYSGLQPYRGKEKKLWWGFYSYHLDKRGLWGDHYKPKDGERASIEVDRWTCLERRMKLNSVNPLKSDGIEELWVDGKLAIRRDGLRFRKVPELRIAFLSLAVYYHGLPELYSRERPIKVYYDHVVIATDRIGCLTRGDE